MGGHRPTISICIPHWQVQDYMTVCLRSIRQHSESYDLEVIVVDNGSRDGSLDYLRSLDWIRLIERPEEVHTNWPTNVFTAWDRGIREAQGEFYITMHSDVFVKSDRWLDPFLRKIEQAPDVAASGAWKLDLENPLYALQKKLVGYATSGIKALFGRERKNTWKEGHYPRDYCAMYRKSVILEHDLTFQLLHGNGGGHSISRQIWDAGYKTRMVPVREMAQHIMHVAHGTAAVSSEKQLNHQRKQKQVERKVDDLFGEDWVVALKQNNSLDAPRRAA